MVRRIAEKLNLDTSFILDELNQKKKNVAKSNPLIKNKKESKKKDFNPYIFVILSGLLGLFTSVIALNYIRGFQNDSINNTQQSNIFLLEKKIYF